MRGQVVFKVNESNTTLKGVMHFLENGLDFIDTLIMLLAGKLKVQYSSETSAKLKQTRQQ
ncbi:hypothetical protein [Heyndrickxia acidicola]|uniref:Uncharacterized protein n=1 Tax=Heyndrickxia acidicola TaxID=209389 RepID=A0ABU6MH93_9BACI|nr:hypothetical protein [Heyndrickxia acidicola]MED1203023.1 hypothetical protein [Heyndrickxia acidicola]